jgi:hypothetical protein
MDEWYRTIRLHNEGKCNPADCRHCAREKETRERTAKAIHKAKSLYYELKSSNVIRAVADYNGGYDEDFVDYVSFTDESGVSQYDTYKTKELPQPTQNWVDTMYSIAYGILGHGFGTGECSTCGSIVLDVEKGILYNNNHEVTNLKEGN